MRTKTMAKDRFPEMWQAWELRNRGMSLRAIGAELGCSYEKVRKLLDEAGRAIVLPGVEEYRKVQDDQIMSIINGLVDKVQRGDTRASEVMIKALERHAKLHGLDKPIEHNVTVSEVTEYDRELAELAREAMMRTHYGQQIEPVGLDRSARPA